jgi:hypothetical protein
MLVDENKILKKNVAEIQQQLANANIRNQHLANMLRIEEATTAKMIKILKLDIKETK